MVPFMDLKTQYHSIKPEIDAAISRILESSQFTLGAEVTAFEDEFSSFCNAEHGIAVNSGTSALHLALLASGVGPGDEVITVSSTFVATVAAVCYTGARAILVDIDPESYTMDINKLEGAITSKTKAVLPVHIYGQSADMDPLMEIARRHNLIVIEDACQAHGAEYKGRRAGSIGDMGCFSFYPGKNLGAYGEGGMVVTSNPEYLRAIRMLRDWGQEKKYHHVLLGYNYRMAGFQGAILRVKLKCLEEWTEARRTHAVLYDELLAGSGVDAPIAMPYNRHVYHLYPVRTHHPDALQKYLQAREIQSGMHYPIPVHMQEAFKDLGYNPGDFPVTEKLAAEELSLPMYPELRSSDIETVANEIHNYTNAVGTE